MLWLARPGLPLNASDQGEKQPDYEMAVVHRAQFIPGDAEYQSLNAGEAQEISLDSLLPLPRPEQFFEVLKFPINHQPIVRHLERFLDLSINPSNRRQLFVVATRHASRHRVRKA